MAEAESSTTTIKRVPVIRNPVIRLEQAFASNAPEDVEPLLSLHLPKLAACDDPYPSTSAASNARLKSGSVTLIDGRSLKVSKAEQDVVLRISTLLRLDEVEALIIWRQFWDMKDDRPKGYLEVLDESILEQVSAHYFGERQGILALVACILHYADDDASPLQHLCLQTLEKIIKPQMPTTLLQSFVRRSQQILPDSVRSSARASTSWAKALIREQKLLLEAVFLLFYGRVRPHAGHLIKVLQVIQETSWGQHQESFAFFDPEASALGNSLVQLLTLISVEVSQIDVAASPSFSLSEKGDQGANYILNPLRLKEAHNLVVNLLQQTPQRASPLGLAWTYLLSRLTSLYEAASPIPASHQEFAKSIMPSFPDDSFIDHEPDDEPFFRKMASHVLGPSCELFATLQLLIASSAFIPGRSKSSRGALDPNALGYLATVRTLLSCLPLLLRLPYLGSRLTDAVRTFALLFELDKMHILAEDFWAFGADTSMDMSGEDEESALARAEREYLEAAVSRFPAQMSDLLLLIRSICGIVPPLPAPGMEVERMTQENCAGATSGYLSSLQGLTCVISGISSVMPLPYETLEGEEESGTTVVRATRPISISPSVNVPQGSWGRFVSPPGQKPVVICWDITWSAWALFGDLVIASVGGARPLSRTNSKRIQDPFSSPEIGEEEQLKDDWAQDFVDAQTISTVVEIMASVIDGAPSLTAKSDLVSIMVPQHSPLDLVQATFVLFERSVANRDGLQDRSASAALRLIAALVPVFPTDIWTMIRASHLLFPALSESTIWRQNRSTASILQREKIVGTYPVTLALLDVVLLLWDEAKCSTLVLNPTAPQMIADVLLRAIAWVRDEIWPSFVNWKYAQLEDKFNLAFKCSRIFGEIGQEAARCGSLIHTSPKEVAIRQVIEYFQTSFITSASVTTLNPIVYMLTATTETQHALELDGRFVDAEALSAAIDQVLLLTECILRICVSSDRRGLLQQLCLAPPSRDRHPSLMHALTHWALLDQQTGATACHIIAYLSKLSIDAPEDWPSMMSAYGDPDRLLSCLKSALVKASGKSLDDTGPAVGGDSTRWFLLAALFDAQPAIAGMLSQLDLSSTVPASLAHSTVNKTVAKVTGVKIAINVVTNLLKSSSAVDDVLVSALAFLDTVCQHAHELDASVSGSLKDDQLGDGLVTLLIADNKSIHLEDSFDHDLQDQAELVRSAAQRAVAQTYAGRILTATIRMFSKEADKQSKSGTKGKSAVVQVGSNKLPNILSHVLSSSANPHLQTRCLANLQAHFPGFELEAYRQIAAVLPQDRFSRLGESFIYDFDTVSLRLQQALSPNMLLTDQNPFGSLRAINMNLSLVESQLALARSWRQLLEVSLPLESDKAYLTDAILAVAELAGCETRSGSFMAIVTTERLDMFLTLFTNYHATNPDIDWYCRILGPLVRLASDDSFSLVYSITHHAKSKWHHVFLQSIFLILQKLLPLGTKAIKSSTCLLLETTLTSLTNLIVDALISMFELLRSGHYDALREDLSLCVSMFADLLNYPPLASFDLSYSRFHDVCSPALVVLSRVDVEGKSIALAEDVITFCSALALQPRYAEYLATDGIIATLFNHPISELASTGSIEILSVKSLNSRTELHCLWCGILGLVASLVNILGKSQQFMEEIVAMMSLYSNQLSSCFTFVSDPGFLWASVEEMEVTSLLYCSVLSKLSNGSCSQQINFEFVGAALSALHDLTRSVTHPHSTASWLEIDVTAPNHLKRAAAKGSDERLVQLHISKIMKVIRNLLFGLIIHSGSLTVLTRDVVEWPLDQVIITPERSTTATEPGSIGNLLELGEACADKFKSQIGVVDEVLVKESVLILEMVSLLCVTQLAVWLQLSSTLKHQTSYYQRVIKEELGIELLSFMEKLALNNTTVNRTTTSSSGGGLLMWAGGTSSGMGKKVGSLLSEEVGQVGGETFEEFMTLLCQFGRQYLVT